MTHPPQTITDDERGALEYLLLHAQPRTHQGRLVADFLLAWWNPAHCGGFAAPAAWELEDEIAEAMAAVFALAVRSRTFPDAFGYGEAFGLLIAQWRPELVCSVVPAGAVTAEMSV
ncbi:DUF7673 family protein [Ralstonia pseudosolanacearum]|uniref:DUF7673 family protein n=1 Tax=Ralstonia pseudosolanacearum TaxID=1310165 RepID=UPI003CEA52E6